MVKARYAVVLVVLAAACGPKRPVLYPNDTLSRTGNEAAQQQIDECLRRAEQYKSGIPAGEVARDTAVGGGAGAAAGAVGGAIAGSAGIGAATGAASGATWGLLTSLFRPRGPDPVYAAFVDRCLRERGYDPIGWK